MPATISAILKLNTNSAPQSKSVADSGGSETSFSQTLAGEIQAKKPVQKSDPATGPASTNNKKSDLDKESSDTNQPQPIDPQSAAEQLAANIASAAAMVRLPDGFNTVDTSASDAATPTISLPTMVNSADALLMLKNSQSADELIAADTEFAQTENFLGDANSAKLNTMAGTSETPALKTVMSEKMPANILPAANSFNNEIINSSLAAQNSNAANQEFNDVQLNNIAPILTMVPSNSAVAGSEQIIAPRVGTPSWDRAIGQKINWMVIGGQQSASLTLNPPDLGPLQVVIHVNNQHADATFISHQPEVRAALENALPKLREIMDQSGIQLGECNVSSQTKQQQEFAHRQANLNQLNGVAPGVGDAINLVDSHQSVRGGVGLVDTFV